jgi:hypothetical protein
VAEVFHGPWFVRVDSTEAGAAQQFSISGSDSSDGGFPGVPGESVSVSGDEWTLTMEWFDGSQFLPSRLRRSATYDVQAGLIVTLAADDGPPETADEDFNDLVLMLQSEDPDLNPIPPQGPPPDFTIPKGSLVPGEHPPDPEG